MASDAAVFLAGVAAGLGGLALFMRAVGLVFAKRPQRATQRVSEQRYSCACGQVFFEPQTAKEHAIESHNAHPDEWLPIMEVS